MFGKEKKAKQAVFPEKKINKNYIIVLYISSDENYYNVNLLFFIPFYV